MIAAGQGSARAQRPNLKGGGSGQPAAAGLAGAGLAAGFLRAAVFLAAAFLAGALRAAGALAFLVSFDETVISLFIAGPRASTLPVEMVRYVEGRTDPLIAALSVVLIVATLAVVLVVERLVGVARAVGK